MDATARERFVFHLEAMSNAMSTFDVTEARRGAEAAAREMGLSFDHALRAHRVGWAVDDEDKNEEVGDVSTPPTVASAENDEGEVSTSPTDRDGGDEATASALSVAAPSHLSTEETERDATIATALNADPARSDRDIAREAGCSPTTVGRARAAAGLTRLVRSVRRGSQNYEMATGSHGPRPGSS